MPDRFYGIAREGDEELRVTIGTSTSGDVIELRVEESADITKKDILRAITRILAAVRTDAGRSDL